MITGEELYKYIMLADTSSSNPPWHLRTAGIQQIYDRAAGFIITHFSIQQQASGFFPPAPSPTNPNPVPGTPTPPYQYTLPTVIPYREPAKLTNPKVNEARVLELYNQGKGEMDLLKMFANMSYEDLKRIIGKK